VTDRERGEIQQQSVHKKLCCVVVHFFISISVMFLFFASICSLLYLSILSIVLTAHCCWQTISLNDRLPLQQIRIGQGPYLHGGRSSRH